MRWGGENPRGEGLSAGDSSPPWGAAKYHFTYLSLANRTGPRERSGPKLTGASCSLPTLLLGLQPKVNSSGAGADPLRDYAKEKD